MRLWWKKIRRLSRISICDITMRVRAIASAMKQLLYLSPNTKYNAILRFITGSTFIPWIIVVLTTIILCCIILLFLYACLQLGNLYADIFDDLKLGIVTGLLTCWEILWVPIARLQLWWREKTPGYQRARKEFFVMLRKELRHWCYVNGWILDENTPEALFDECIRTPIYKSYKICEWTDRYRREYCYHNQDLIYLSALAMACLYIYLRNVWKLLDAIDFVCGCLGKVCAWLATTKIFGTHATVILFVVEAWGPLHANILILIVYFLIIKRGLRTVFDVYSVAHLKQRITREQYVKLRNWYLWSSLAILILWFFIPWSYCSLGPTLSFAYLFFIAGVPKAVTWY